MDPHSLSLSCTYETVAVVVNFMWQLGRAMGCPDSWWSLFLGYLWGCPWKRLVFESAEWRSPHQHEWASPNLLRVGREQEGGERTNLLLLGEAGTPTFSCLQESELLVLGPWIRCIPVAPLIFRPSSLDWTTPPAFLGLQLAGGRWWDFSASIVVQADS